VKLLAATYDPKQIVWFRIDRHLALVALVFMPRMGFDLFRTHHIGSQLVNSVMMLLSTLFFFFRGQIGRCRRSDLDQLRGAARGGDLAWPVLGERITAMRVAAVVVGFAGVLVVIRRAGRSSSGPRSCCSAAPSATRLSDHDPPPPAGVDIRRPRSSTASCWAPS